MARGRRTRGPDLRSKSNQRVYGAFVLVVAFCLAIPVIAVVGAGISAVEKVGIWAGYVQPPPPRPEPSLDAGQTPKVKPKGNKPK